MRNSKLLTWSCAAVLLLLCIDVRASLIDFDATAPDGTYTISTALGSAVSMAAPDAILADGGEIFHVTFSSALPFLTADLSGGDDFALVHSFNIDDIEFLVVPEPPANLLLGLGALIMPTVYRMSPEINNHA